MIIDAHSHFIPEALINEFKKENNLFKAHIIKKGDKKFIEHEEGFRYPLFKEFYDVDAKINDLEKMRIDRAILSPSPTVFFYWSMPEIAREVSRICNDWVYSFTKKYPEHFIPMGTLPMINVEDSLSEFERIISKYKMQMIEIGPHINGENLDEAKFYPIFELAEKNNILIFLHPYYVGTKPMFKKYNLTNTIGNPLDTTLGLAHLIYGGVFEKYPKLKVLAAHGGGYFPYQLGRFNHAFKVREEAKVITKLAPDNYLDNIFFDSITHWDESLKFLIESLGAQHVVIGTDYPFDMGDYDIVETLKCLNISEEEKERIYSKNIVDFLN